MNKSNATLEVESLKKSFGEKEVLTDVNLKVGPGECISLLGSNGAGKTTIIRAICNLITIDSGSVKINGKPINQSNMSKLGVVLEGSRNCHWRLTPYENARYFSTLKQRFTKESKHRINDVMEKLGLMKYRDTRVSSLSTGNKQRVSMLCALAANADILILDEPTLGLDIEAVDNLKDLLKEIVSSYNKSLLITSHDYPFIENICESSMVLSGGKIVYTGSTIGLRNRLFTHEMTLRSKKANEISNDIEQVTQGLSVNTSLCEDGLTIYFKSLEDTMKVAESLLRLRPVLTDFSVVPASLENAYKAITTDSMA